MKVYVVYCSRDLIRETDGVEKIFSTKEKAEQFLSENVKKFASDGYYLYVEETEVE